MLCRKITVKTASYVKRSFFIYSILFTTVYCYVIMPVSGELETNGNMTLKCRFFIFFLQCRADHASRVLFEMINKEPNKIGLFGAGCSLVSERLAEVAKTWNLLMVSTLTLVTITMTYSERRFKRCLDRRKKNSL